MWTILLKCILWIFYLLAIYLFVKGYKRYKISFWWLLLLIFFPISMVAVYEWQRNKAQQPGAPKTTSNAINLLFVIICSAATVIPNTIAYYKIMDGASADVLSAMNETTAICIIVTVVLYAVYRIGRTITQK